MELILEVNAASTQKDFGLDKLPLASSYSKDAKLNQRKRINEIILANMDKSFPAIELPFELFYEIKQEMAESGWDKDGTWYYPINLEQFVTELPTNTEENKVISAKRFYESTMKQQLMELHVEIEKSREKGLQTIRFKFPLYKVIGDKLKAQGWGVTINRGFTSNIPPYTRLEIK